MARNKYPNTRKRAVDRVISKIVQTPGVSQTDLQLYEADQSVTLVRTIIALAFQDVAASASITYAEMGIQVAPSGNLGAWDPVLDTATITQDNNAQQNELWRHLDVLTFGRADKKIYVDLKSMRKLKRFDKIYWSDIASTGSKFKIVGIIVQFFKES